MDDKLWRLDVGQRKVVVGAIKFGMAHFSGSAFGGNFLPSGTFDLVPNTFGQPRKKNRSVFKSDFQPDRKIIVFYDFPWLVTRSHVELSWARQ